MTTIMMSEESEEVYIKDTPLPSQTEVVIETFNVESESKEIVVETINSVEPELKEISFTEVEIATSEIVDLELSIGDQTVIVEGEISAEEVNEKSTDELNKTEETEENEDATLESPISKPSRELKLLLELSKEANLDTNIPYKRKSLDPNKHVEHLDHRYASMPIIDGKRSMRSQNPEFVVKNQKFLSKLSSDGGESHGTSDNEEKSTNDKEEKNTKDKGEKSSKDKGDKTPKKKEYFAIGGAIDENTKKLLEPAMALIQNHKDGFCWRCHREGINISCKTCPRSYHLKCLKHSNIAEHWVCPECVVILNAENTKTRSFALKDMSLEQLCGLLKFALKRMEKCNDSDPFLHSVKEVDFPDYKKYIVEPMDLDRMQRNIQDNLYGSTNAFEADAKWLLHNSIIFNSYQSKLTAVAKTILKVCKQEMSEIENCPTCYLNANTKQNWFTEVCPKPHLLLWAKLKGFPYWPAKAMSTNSQGMVDVRFFGAHDRAWVPIRECFLYSLKDPNPHKQMKSDIIECVKEVDMHIENLKKVYGDFVYAPYRTPYDPENEIKQLQLALSSYSPNHHTPPPRKFLKIDNLLKRRTTIDKPATEKPQKQCKNSEPLDAFGKETHKTDNKETVGYGTDDEMGNDDEMSVDCSVTDGINGQEQNRLSTSLVNSNVKSKTISKRHRSRSRRNSEQSMKSDISRVSSISDKIYTVDISENMEVGLANENINIKVTENVSVEKTNLTESKNPSPSALKISEKLMRKLSNTNLDKSVNKEMKMAEVVNDNRVQINSVEDTELDIIESESRPSINDMKQILGFSPENVSTEKGNVDRNISDSVKDDSNDRNNEITTEKSKSEPTKSKSELIQSSPIKSIPEPTKSKSEPTKSKPEPTKSKSEPTKSKSEPTKSKSEPTKSKSDPAKSELERTKPKSEPTKSRTENTEKPTALTSEKRNEAMENSSNTVSSTTIDTSAQNNLPVDDLLEEMYSVVVDAAGTSQRHANPFRIKNKELTPNKISNKRKASDENQNGSPIHNKFIKLVDINAITRTPGELLTSTPIQKSILKNRLTPTMSKSIEKPIFENTISKQLEKPVVENNTSDAIEIKSEPNSDAENEDMEAKKQYLSALNISEKTEKISKPPEKEKMKTRTDVAKAIEKPCGVRRKSTEPTVAGDNQRNALQKFIKQLPPKQRARKTFPRRSTSSPKLITKNDTLRVTKIINSTPPARVTTQESQHSNSVLNSSSNNKNLMILSQPSQSGNTLTVLPSNQTITYTGNIGNPLFTMVQQPPFGNFMVPTTALTPVPPLNPILDRNVPNITTSQVDTPTSLAVSNLIASANAIFTSTGQQLTINNASTVTLTTSVTTAPITSVASTSNNSGNVTILNGQAPLPNISTPNRSIAESNDDYGYLSGYIPDNVTKSITDLIHRAPPKLKPRPPGPLSNSFDGGLPSSAGRVTSTVNSIAHKLTDYFRGMLIETLTDLGTIDNAEALITGLRLENEKLKHKHAEEILEIKKNINSILRDVQKSIIDERERVIEETKAACEVETIKRIDEVKSRQWCANCMKEAQFYCCWNTSYCDYPCQLKHWPKHTSKCSQNPNASQSELPHMAKLATPLILRKTSAPPKGVFTQKQIGSKPHTKDILSKPSPNRSSTTTIKTSTVNTISYMPRKIKSVSVLTHTSQQNVSGKSSSASQNFVVTPTKSKTTMEID